jgi:hypothetical protein
MKIIERDAKKTTEKSLPAPPDLSYLFDKGLMEGTEVDPADQAKAKKLTLNSTSSLSTSVNNANISSDDVDGIWTRQDVPSLGVPYGITHLWVRALTVPMLAQVHAAQSTGANPERQQQALTMLIDALKPTIKDFDIRNLTAPDWTSHLYWLRLNSYPRSPLTIPWTSRYGNDNVTRVTSSNFEFEELKMTREEYLDWQKKGITFPTVRDMELLSDPSLSDETRWTITYAQYVYIEGPPTPDLMRRKIAKLEEYGVGHIALINEFADKCSHGVIEQVRVRDEKFDLDNAIDYISNEVDTLASILDQAYSTTDGDETLSSLIALTNQAKVRADELTMLRKVKENNGLTENGQRFVPESEVVAIASANATMLFP